MKLKIAVVVGPEGVGKSSVLKAFACGLIEDKCTNNPAIKPAVIEPKEDLAYYGFKKASLDEEWRAVDWHVKAGDVEIDWRKLLTSQKERTTRVKDIVMTCTYHGKKVIVASEGDYSWSWLVMLKEIEKEFPNIGEHDEVLLFCTSRVENAKEMGLRGVELCPPDNQILFNSVVVKLFELKDAKLDKGQGGRIKSELATLRDLNRQFDEWVEMKRKTSCKLSNWWHRIVCD